MKIFISAILILGMVLCGSVSSLSDDKGKLRPRISTDVESVSEQENALSPGLTGELQWSGELTDLEDRAMALLKENDQLQYDSQELKNKSDHLNALIKDQDIKNQELRDVIEQKRSIGAGEVQVQRALVKQAHWQKQLEEKIAAQKEIEETIAAIEKKTTLGNLKLKSLGYGHDANEQSAQLDVEIQFLQMELQKSSEQLDALNKELAGSISPDTKPADADIAALTDEIKQLQDQMVELENQFLADQKAPAPVVDLSGEINQLEQKKNQLQESIKEIRAKAVKMDRNQDLGIASARMKELVKTMSIVDTANAQIREEELYLKENIAILNNHIKKLEYRAETVRAMKSPTQSSR